VRGERTLVNWHLEHFRDPARVVPGSLMPNMGLSEEQIDLLTFYMLSLRRSEVPEAYWPKDRIRAERFGEREFATDGHTLYETFCAACHGDRGQGLRYPGMPLFPAVGNPDLYAVAADDFLVETIRIGRPGRRMPGFGEEGGGLRREEIRRIVSYLREQSGVPEPEVSEPPRWVTADAVAGETLYAARCAGCHGASGEGTEAPALNNPGLLSIASDSYLVETIARGRRDTAMNGFRHASAIHPTLSEAEIQSIVAFIRTWEESSP
jgi:cytochrome c oxidase cbb3-type subunit III